MNVTCLEYQPVNRQPIMHRHPLAVHDILLTRPIGADSKSSPKSATGDCKLQVVRAENGKVLA